MQDLYFNLSQKLYLLCETFHNKWSVWVRDRLCGILLQL